MYKSRLFVMGLTLVASSGCVSYQQKPLKPKAVFDEVDRLRKSSKSLGEDEFTFSKASRLISENSPELDEIRSAYDQLKSVSNIKTPWANPSLEVGPDFGSNLGPGATNKIQPFIGVGFSIPIAGKLSKNDDLNSAISKKAFIEVQSKHRMLYLELRELYTRLYITYQKRHVQEVLLTVNSKIINSAESMLSIGSISALDVEMLKLDGKSYEYSSLDLTKEITEITSKLSVILGIDANDLREIKRSYLPELREKPLGNDKLKAILLENNPELVKLRYDYEIAERNLRLEISKQYPDINFGLDREKEVGGNESTFGLRLGIDIPIFDRNKKGIVYAEKERERVKKQYILTLHQQLSKLAQLNTNLKLNFRKYALMRDYILISAIKNLEISKQEFENGNIDILKYLDVIRTFQQTKNEAVSAESELRQSWIQIEKTLGFPIIYFPDEPEFNPLFANQFELSRTENNNDK